MREDGTLPVSAGVMQGDLAGVGSSCGVERGEAPRSASPPPYVSYAWAGSRPPARWRSRAFADAETSAVVPGHAVGVGSVVSRSSGHPVGLAAARLRAH